MTAAASKTGNRRDLVRRLFPIVLAVGAIGTTAWLQPGAIAFMTGAEWSVKVPDLALIARRGPILQTHLFSALAALAIGVVIMLRPKGVGLHKALGWTWVLAMASTAISSLFLPSFTGTRFGLIHLLSGWTIIALPMAVAAIRRGDVTRHRRGMTGLFVGGLLVAGALTFIPGRLMWRVFFG